MFDFDKFTQAVRGAVASYSKTLASVREDIDRAEGELEDAMYAPLAKSDVRALMIKWIEGHRATHQAQMVEHFAAIAPNWRLGKDAGVFEDHMRTRPLFQQSRLDLAPTAGAMVAQSTDSAVLSARRVEMMLCGVFGEHLLKVVDAALEATPWPAGALTSSERDRRVTVAKAKLTQLRKAEADLLRAAKEAGLTAGD